MNFGPYFPVMTTFVGFVDTNLRQMSDVWTRITIWLSALAALRLYGSMRRFQVLLLVLFWGLAFCRAEDPASEVKFREAVTRGIQYLVAHQKPNGSFEGPISRGKVFNTNAHTALVMLALHDAGSRASDASDSGRALASAARYLCRDVAATTTEGFPGVYLGRQDLSRMYGHGLMTQALASVVGEIEDPVLQAEIRTRVLEAVTYIRASHQVKKSLLNAGGWRYEGMSIDSDISVTVCQLLALRKAVDHAKAAMPQFMWDQSARYVKRAAERPRLQPGQSGAFGYETYGDRATFSTTGMGVVALQCCAQGDSPEVKAGQSYIDQADITPDQPWFSWGMKYCSLAMLDADAKQKEKFRTLLSKVLLPLQQADGSWLPENKNESRLGAVFATALAVSALGPWAGDK